MPPEKAAFIVQRRRKVMKEKSIRVKSPMWIFKAVFGMVGFIMLAVGIILLIRTFSFMEDAAIVEGKITRIETSVDRDGETNHSAYVDYEYDGEEYGKVRLPEYTSSMYEGKIVEIYIDRENPGKVHMKSMVYIAPIIFISIGAVFFTIAMVFVFVSVKKKRREALLIKNGKKVYGQVKGGIVDRTYRVNGKYPYRFECVYEDINSGQPVICTSDRTWETPDMYVGMQVLIYIDVNDRSHYHVDLDSIFKYG